MKSLFLLTALFLMTTPAAGLAQEGALPDVTAATDLTAQNAAPGGVTVPSVTASGGADLMAAPQQEDSEGRPRSPRGTLNVARNIIQDRFPGLKDRIEMDVSPAGVLVVAGEVTYLADKLAVGRALVDVPGGTAVLNAITIRPPLRSDEAIRRDVERLLRVDPELPNVRVQVIRQVVYIPEGAVPDLFITQAVQRVGRIPGVVDVLVGPLS